MIISKFPALERKLHEKLHMTYLNEEGEHVYEILRFRSGHTSIYYYKAYFFTFNRITISHNAV